MLEDLAKARRLLDEIEDFAAKAESEQWNRAPTPMAEKVGKRTAGVISDPTGELATDMHRLELRAVVTKTERDARLLVEALERLHFRLEKAVTPYG